ncbi:MAG: response regulator transcription factor [candidate division KSB1 bacterium]|nr:response regulator transcription factor [candidate division KSB1 bacterium]MDQ7063252.1 response regulator transcription factor [candidate division KSB1 bacterium]
MHRVLIADDHPLFRRGLAQIIDTLSGFKVIAEAGDGHEALQQLRECTPHIAILDIAMPGKDGLEVARTLQEQTDPNIKIVFLTMYREEAYLDRALELGAVGYLLKENAVSEVVQCLQAVIRGHIYISPSLSGYLIQRKQRQERLQETTPGLKQLTPTERQILQCIAQGQTSREIAAALHVSIRTVQNHRHHICQKLDLRGYNKLLEFALNHKSEL